MHLMKTTTKTAAEMTMNAMRAEMPRAARIQASAMAKAVSAHLRMTVAGELGIAVAYTLFTNPGADVTSVIRDAIAFRGLNVNVDAVVAAMVSA